MVDATVAAAIVSGSFGLVAAVIAGWRMVVTERATKETHASRELMTESAQAVREWKGLYLAQKAETAELRALLLEEQHQRAQCEERCTALEQRQQEWMDRVEWIRETGDDSTHD